MLLLLSISFHEWTISRIYLSTCHHLTQRNLTPYPTQISHFPRHVDQQVSNLLDKERGREREEKSFDPGLSKGSRGLVGGWQGCYDVLRCVVATKTMWLVTVIVRNVGLCAVTNPVHRLRSLSPLPSPIPSILRDKRLSIQRLHGIMERTNHPFSRDSFWIFLWRKFLLRSAGFN